jgi:hypothetical protein
MDHTVHLRRISFSKGTSGIVPSSNLRGNVDITVKLRHIMIGLTVAAASGCSTSTPSSSSTSLTSPFPANAGTQSLKAALLTTNDLQAVPGAPSDIRTIEPTGANSVFTDPDPRGPCGAHIPYPNFSTGATLAIQSSQLAGAEVAVDLPDAQAADFLAAMQADTHFGCPAYRSTTNTGTTQTARFIASLSMPASVDQAIGDQFSITSGGHTVDVYLLAIRSGKRLDFLLLLSPAPLAKSFISRLATAATAKLKASVPTH